MQSYKTFMLKVYKKEHNPLGDLARDIELDKNFPNRSDNKKEILAYLDDVRACIETEEAFKESWKAYKAYKKSVKNMRRKYEGSGKKG